MRMGFYASYTTAGLLYLVPFVVMEIVNLSTGVITYINQQVEVNAWVIGFPADPESSIPVGGLVPYDYNSAYNWESLADMIKQLVASNQDLTLDLTELIDSLDNPEALVPITQDTVLNPELIGAMFPPDPNKPDGNVELDKGPWWLLPLLLLFGGKGPNGEDSLVEQLFDSIEEIGDYVSGFFSYVSGLWDCLPGQIQGFLIVSFCLLLLATVIRRLLN